jgi:uncharacterized protein involved in type VI secretion and phage assembly
MTRLDLLDSPSDREAARIDGVVPGIVIDNKDPQGLGRVRVKVPGLSNDEVGPWARIATLMAGNQRGTFFLPEVNDEVLIAFESGDISRPYVLGALWNGKDQPPATNSDGKNNLRFIKSRSGHLIRLDDTGGSEKIEIVDKSGANKIVIDTSGKSITIESDQDININAPNGKITLSATNLEIKTSSDAKINAGGDLNIQASGSTDIKGSTINLN